ncbi:MAG: bifunctional adenosylcobinamide kinase/adenosylcobinamide-phosphate guanylyltransferase [Anaerolineae bacterium]|jgi:adenosylcobinamide kinase/adenosylcobinamide-phosphate guanylyltransferase|nr:bifunctional adenosylcobinamide kinase/adenosylcobinamide-phosphate guanylyltransferase [Anaerolineae bacterium]MBT4459755.1 bifunctional adenosylcobinamide kinase/adenosylcobinamide-phosphate guanylyltransferase [Anaerolineae bacterium]MBT6061251.1 bifunctional adenosylcobinamide kinase/adenosylcobinamide-phosphate guanylyltransferase [Anaerolineae bacterium]MBT6811637.1 bifunctional adenosylcobinamide kinase/adenosylcobinamide-phosphate guanylyltransferase [Anaerolineae bacterium]MBT777375
MGKLTLILGGARSGKSSYAEKRAKELGGDNVLYLATSQIKDKEMQERVDKHRADRPAAWGTLEAPRDLANALRKPQQASDQERPADVILLDCVTFLVANHLMDAAAPEDDPFDDPSADPFAKQIEAAVVAEVESLIEYVQKNDVEMLVVSNEVGLGLVPAYELGRAYRDILGRANQILARHADEVLFFVAGLPMKVK